MDSIFKDVEHAFEQQTLNVVGDWPKWIKGQFLRNGPGRFSMGQQKMKHWFDGYALLHRFDIDGDHITYENKFLESDDYLKDKSSGRIKSAQWGTAPDICASMFSKFFSTFEKVEASNNNVNILKLGKRYFGISDYSTLVEFDPESLQTKGTFSFVDKLGRKFMLSAAHPSFNQNAEVFNVVTELGPKPKIHVYRFNKNTLTREIVSSMHTKKASYYHSFALTEKYFVFIEQPLYVDLVGLIFSRMKGRSFADNLVWNSQKPCRFHILNLQTKEWQVIDGDNFFFFHTVNAFEKEGDIIIDLCSYEDFSVHKAFYFDGMSEENHAASSPKFRRIQIDLKSRKIKSNFLFEQSVELVRINQKHQTKPYRYAYGMGHDRPEIKIPFEALLKLDLEEGKCTTWSDSGWYPSEPVFIENGLEEDDGVLLSMGINPAEQKTRLYAINPKDMKTMAYAEANTYSPPGLHGNFYTT